MPEPHPLRLDRSRYHASVHGNFDSCVRFYQDGLPFDAAGALCAELCSAEQLALADRNTPPQMPDAGDRIPGKSEDLTSDIRSPTSDVNLERWAKGEVRYRPNKVFAAIRERYNKSVTTFADAAEFLVNDVKLIPASQASKKLLAMGGVTQSREEP
jgi:hypothetical protein